MQNERARSPSHAATDPSLTAHVFVLCAPFDPCVFPSQHREPALGRTKVLYSINTHEVQRECLLSSVSAYLNRF